MYRDAKEELKRLEEALLEEEQTDEETAPARKKPTGVLGAIIILLILGILAVVAYWVIGFGRGSV